MYAGSASADVVTSYSGHPGARNITNKAPLVVNNQNIRERCPGGRGTVTIRSTVNAPRTQGTTTITLPAVCLRFGAGVPLTFNVPGLEFRAVLNMESGMALLSNPPWTGGTAGTVSTCVSFPGPGPGVGCKSTRMTLTSGSGSPPTTYAQLVNGNRYGPGVSTQGMVVGETATITVYLYLDWYNTVSGDHAIIQVDRVTLVIKQA